MREKKKTLQPSIAIVGSGSLATSLALSLHESGFTITEVVSRDSPRSLRRARKLAERVGAREVTAASATLDAVLLWFCVPDREIATAAAGVAEHMRKHARSKLRFAFHSSGALLSRELDPLRKVGAAAASVHPLMTFVAGSHPSLEGVPFACEGDPGATRVARQIVRELGGCSFLLRAERKAMYHAWATMSSPLLVALLVTLEETARAAGLTRGDARRKSLPIIRQTLANYSKLGPTRSFSGPLIRGDAETIKRHLEALRSKPQTRQVYIALARAAVQGLPVKNRRTLSLLLG